MELGLLLLIRPINIYIHIFHILILFCLSLFFYKDLQDESNRFDGEKYLELVKSSSKRNIAAIDDTNTDTDNQENE